MIIIPILIIFILLTMIAIQMALIWETNDNPIRIIKLGFKLIINSGLLLATTRFMSTLINTKNDNEVLCDEFKSNNRFDLFDKYGCSLEIDWLAEMTGFLANSALDSISWMIPFVFASVGAGVLTHGLVSADTNKSVINEFISKRSTITQKALNWLVKTERKNL